MKFHHRHRRVERLTIKLRKLEQAKSRKSSFVKKQSSYRKQPPASKEKPVKNDNVDELAEEILAKISNKLLEKIRSEALNKQREPYPVVLSDPIIVKEEKTKSKSNNKAVKNEREKKGEKNLAKNALETPLSHANNKSKTCQIHI